MRHPLAKWRVPLALGIGLLYGLLTRLSWGYEPLQGIFGTPVSMSYLFLTPFVLGALVALVGMLVAPTRNVSFWGVAMPILAIIIGTVAALISHLEALFCLIVAFPILMTMAILGGVITSLLMRQMRPSSLKFYSSSLLFLPYLVAPIEQMLDLPPEEITMHDSILVQAPAEVIWDQIASVPEIQQDEIRNSWIYQLGFPRPRAATLDHHGVGGKRIATFEREVSFFEVIDTWNPPQSLSFSIEADPAFIPANAFDEHIIVGGRFYDVLDGKYEIEALDPHQCRLHLTSRHRLGSHFNRYAEWWSRVIMKEIQTTILEVVAQRAEAASSHAEGNR
ncbi:hypothetical protein [Roseibacillus ishigakijimensis]|uniref:Polyketide cyclase / dehydrase and lipid transport n=1 Tax=Roseibacillus ishigakijimensis TaxID=454146 RepID=A0A934VL66_9BACT|nr:hypothetical protein [Roseibacillus ishigakijimensis]